MPRHREVNQSNSGPRQTLLCALAGALLLLCAAPACAPAQVDDGAPGAVTHPDAATVASQDTGSAAAAAHGDGARTAQSNLAARSGGWRLLATDSPYLRQHADNPVEWHPWGPEAFALAAELNRPVFLSIGYSSCHWCHVMEHESFMNEATAAYMNSHYVCIKVDREQRPDVDQRYMDAVQAMTGSGGWPLSAWLTPDGKPYHAGTYYPPVGRGRMPSFMKMLTDLSNAWTNDRQNILDLTEKNDPILLADRLPKAEPFETDVLLAAATQELIEGLDPVLGGMASRGPNRFPPSMVLRFLLRRSLRTDDIDLGPALVTLDAMSKGGMRDQVGGGFHRYSTDPRWDVPHFEKMLYDNALLSSAYAEAYAVTGEARFARVARDTLSWLLDDMRSPEGLFYSARDADSLPYDEQGQATSDHAEEGDVYLWTPGELKRVLGDTDGAHFARLFEITDEGNFERGLSIPRPRRNVDELAADPGDGLPSGAEFVTWLDTQRDRLMGVRARRPQAFRDEKCLTSWNGLALSAFALSARLLDDEPFRVVTGELAHALMTELSYRDEQGALQLHHQLFEGRASGAGDLTDHAYLAWGILDAYETTGNADLLAFAWELAFAMHERFEDPDKGGFFLTLGDDPLLPSRGRKVVDGARPSPQSIALWIFARLSPLDDDGVLRASLDKALARLGGLTSGAAASLPSLLLTLDAWAGPLAEVVLDGAPENPDYQALLAAARSTFLPAALLVARAPEAAAALAGAGVQEMPSLLSDRTADEGAMVWICREGVCLAPISEAAGLADQWSFVIKP